MLDQYIDKRGKIQLSDFELVPYRFSNSYITGKRIKHDIDGFCCYVNPIDAVCEASVKKGEIFLYRIGCITYSFNYLIGTAVSLLYGDRWWRGILKKQKLPYNERCYPIARKVHFQINTDFGLVVWSFIKIKRSKKKDV